MKTREYRELAAEELEQQRLERLKEYFDLRMKKAYAELDNPLRLRTLRREIAGINTVLCERRRGKR